MTLNVDQGEIAKFSEMSDTWWSPNGSFALIHKLNPLRTTYAIEQFLNATGASTLVGYKVLDLGCGAGILSESLAKAGAQVIAVDMSSDALEAGRIHLEVSGISNIQYLQQTAEELVQQHFESFDFIVCMEMIEHVPSFASIVESISKLLKKGGVVVMSTINRTFAAQAQIIIAAEHLLKWLPRGTHQSNKFITPNELKETASFYGLQMLDLKGYKYDFAKDSFYLSPKVDVNYFMSFIKN